MSPVVLNTGSSALEDTQERAQSVDFSTTLTH